MAVPPSHQINTRSSTATESLRRRTISAAANERNELPCMRRCCGIVLARRDGQEVTKMALDMTAQLVPMVWAMVGLMVVSAVSVLLSHE